MLYQNKHLERNSIVFRDWRMPIYHVGQNLVLNIPMTGIEINIKNYMVFMWVKNWFCRVIPLTGISIWCSCGSNIGTVVAIPCLASQSLRLDWLTQCQVSMLWQGETASLICDFLLSVAARTLIWANPSPTFTIHDAWTQPRNNDRTSSIWDRPT